MADTTGTFDSSVSSPDVVFLGGIYFDKDAPKPTSVILGGGIIALYAPEPTIIFIDYETSLDGIIPIPTLLAENTSTYGASDNLSIPVAEIAIDVGRTAGSITAVAEIPTAVIESTYTIGSTAIDAIVPDVFVKSVYTTGIFSAEARAPKALVVSIYTLGSCSSEIQLPQLIAESNSTSGFLPIDILIPELELSSNYTLGFLEISTPKVTIKYTFLFGTVGGLSINQPNPGIDLTGFTSSFGSFEGYSPVGSLQISVPKTRRF